MTPRPRTSRAAQDTARFEQDRRARSRASTGTREARGADRRSAPESRLSRCRRRAPASRAFAAALEPKSRRTSRPAARTTDSAPFATEWPRTGSVVGAPGGRTSSLPAQILSWTIPPNQIEDAREADATLLNAAAFERESTLQFSGGPRSGPSAATGVGRLARPCDNQVCADLTQGASSCK
jgi:hypothetical protein